MENKIERITDEDIHTYAGILGDVGVLIELERWTVWDTLTLYQTKGYKNYKRHYLKIIFDSVDENFKLHKSQRPINTTFCKINFKGKDGNVYRGNLKGDDATIVLAHETLDCSQLGKEHLEEFLDFYVEDTVRYFIKETISRVDGVYDDHMWVRLRMVVLFIWNMQMLDFLEVEVGKEQGVPLVVLGRSLEKVVDKMKPVEVTKGKDVYIEMEDIVKDSRYHRRVKGGKH